MAIDVLVRSRYRRGTPIPPVGTRWSGCDASSSLQFATVGSPEWGLLYLATFRLVALSEQKSPNLAIFS